MTDVNSCSLGREVAHQPFICLRNNVSAACSKSGKLSAGLCFAAQPSAGDTDSMEEPEQAPDSSMARPKARRWGGIQFVDPVIPTEQGASQPLNASP